MKMNWRKRKWPWKPILQPNFPLTHSFFTHLTIAKFFSHQLLELQQFFPGALQISSPEKQQLPIRSSQSLHCLEINEPLSREEQLFFRDAYSMFLAFLGLGVSIATITSEREEELWALSPDIKRKRKDCKAPFQGQKGLFNLGEGRLVCGHKERNCMQSPRNLCGQK